MHVTISSNYPSWYAYWYDHDGYERYYYNNPTYFEETNSTGPDSPGGIGHSVIVYDGNNNVIASYNHPPEYIDPYSPVLPDDGGTGAGGGPTAPVGPAVPPYCEISISERDSRVFDYSVDTNYSEYTIEYLDCDGYGGELIDNPGSITVIGKPAADGDPILTITVRDSGGTVLAEKSAF